MRAAFHQTTAISLKLLQLREAQEWIAKNTAAQPEEKAERLQEIDAAQRESICCRLPPCAPATHLHLQASSKNMRNFAKKRQRLLLLRPPSLPLHHTAHPTPLPAAPASQCQSLPHLTPLFLSRAAVRRSQHRRCSSRDRRRVLCRCLLTRSCSTRVVDENGRCLRCSLTIFRKVCATFRFKTFFWFSSRHCAAHLCLN